MSEAQVVRCPNCGCDYKTAQDLRVWKDESLILSKEECKLLATEFSTYSVGHHNATETREIIRKIMKIANGVSLDDQSRSTRYGI